MKRPRGKATDDAIRGSKTDDAMLLYEAPTGIAIFYFDAGYLENQGEDFWACIPQFSLKMFMKNDNGSTFIDLVNKAIDDRLAKRLTRWCRSKKKLIVGSAEYKKIIERNLKITCTNVGVPHDEVVFGPKNPIGTLLPEETSELTKNDHHPMREEIVMFLHQHNIDMKPEMVDKYVVDTLHHLHRIELRENEHLKFFRILLQGFMVTLGIDTTNWSLIQFATVPKMICHPTASYQISHPDEIFSDDENLKIEAIAPDYKKTFKKIDPLSVYDDVFSLHTEKTVTLADLCIFVMEAERAQEKADVIRLREDHSLGEPNMTDLPTTDSCQLEAPNSAESKQQVILNQTCISEVRQCLIPDKVQEKLAANMDDVERNMQARDNDVQSMDHYAKKLTASAFDLLGNKKDEHTGTSVTEMNLHGNLGDDGKKKQSGGTEGIRDTSMSSKSGGTEGIRDTSMSSKSESNKQKDVISATSDIPKSGPLKDLNGDGKKPTASTLGPLGKQDEHSDTSNPVGDDKENKKARDTDVQSMDSGKKKLTPVLLGNKKNEEFNATSSMFNSGLNEQKKVIVATNEITAASPPAGVQSTGGDKRNSGSSNIPNSGKLKDLIEWDDKEDMEREKKEAGSKKWSFLRPSGRRPKVIQTCMPFNCFYRVH